MTIGAMFAVYHVGLAGLFTPLMTQALSGLRRELYADASATYSTTQQFAGAAGIATLIGLRRSFSGPTGVSLDGVHASFGAAAALTIIPVITSPLLLRAVRPQQARTVAE